MEPCIITATLVLVALLVLGAPIAVSLGVSVMLAILQADMPMLFFIQKLTNTFDSFPIMAIPFFVISGEIMSQGTMAKNLLEFATTLVGHRKGGLALIAVLTCLFYGALCGSSPAATAAVGGMIIPTMLKENYPRDFATAVVVSGGCLGVMIPPSVPLIVYGSTAQTSISDLFLASTLPGILVGIALMIVAYVLVRKNGYGIMRPKASWKERAEAFRVAKWAILVPVIVLGGIYGGIVTPTEAGVVAVVYSFIVEAFITRNLTREKMGKVALNSMYTVGMIFFVLVCANALGTLMVYYDVHEVMLEFMEELSMGKTGTILFVLAILLFLGTFMDTGACILILTPIFVPVMQAVGMSPVQFGVVMTIALAVGFLTPPVGVNLFVGCGLSGVPFGKLCVAVIPFLIAILAMLLLISFVPPLSMCFIG